MITTGQTDSQIDTSGLAFAEKKRGRFIDRIFLRLPLVTVTYLAKISIPPFAQMGLVLGIPLVFAVAIIGIITRRLKFDLRRTVAFLLLASYLLILQVLSNNPYSLSSLSLFLVIYSPFIVRLAHTPRTSDGMYKYFIFTSLVIGVCGIIQYFAQFQIGHLYAFPIDNFLPTPYLIGLYNNQAILEYGSDIVRSNGIFMIEPSAFSQLMATGIMLEIANKKRLWIMGVLAASILVSHSGTGVLLLVVCLAYDTIVQRRWQVLVGIFAVVLFVAVAEAVGVGSMFETFFKRSDEFGKPGSSGSMRFVEGFFLFREVLWDHPLNALWGTGAGTFVHYALVSNFLASEMFLFKVVLEFGIFGALFFCIFVAYCLVISKGVPGAKLPVMMVILMGGLYTPFGHCMAMSLIFWVDTSNKEKELIT